MLTLSELMDTCLSTILCSDAFAPLATFPVQLLVGDPIFPAKQGGSLSSPQPIVLEKVRPLDSTMAS